MSHRAPTLAFAPALVIVGLLLGSSIAAAQAAGQLDIPTPPSDYVVPPVQDEQAPDELAPSGPTLEPFRDPGEEPDVPDPGELASTPEPAAAAVIDWPPAPSSVTEEGIRNPTYGLEPDDGLLWLGGMFFLSVYVTALATTLPFAFTCDWRGCPEPAHAAFAFIPFVQWGVALGGQGLAYVGGILGSIFEVISAVIFIAGANHHRASMRPGREAGDVSLAGDGIQIAF